MKEIWCDKGIYCLVVHVCSLKILRIGALGHIDFQGKYLYIGSAQNNLKKRLDRHLCSSKKLHWHIDYLLEEAKVLDFYYKELAKEAECRIAGFLESSKGVKGFGCSDCNCRSHLFKIDNKDLDSLIKHFQLR